MIGFTDNYRDHSNRDGYQFEFFCERCGNGYTSSFKHSVTGFGGKLLRMGGDLVGGERGVCTNCAPKLDQEIAGLQASAQHDQLRDRIGRQDRTAGVQYGHEVTARCPSCSNDSGGGKYCQHCGTPLAAAPEASRFCGQCGTKLGASAMFCTGCGSQTV